MSGSDLTEACRDAAMVPIREYIRSFTGDEGKRRLEAGGRGGISRDEVRGVENSDFFRKAAGGRRPVEDEVREEFGRAVDEAMGRIEESKDAEDFREVDEARVD
jgi:SpoVK/Ycf46/Vps4 family AAA+-type ATPase